MGDIIVLSAFGILLTAIGIINMTGNISSLHWYHRQRVTEENRKPFGKLVGIGTVIMGASMMVCAAFLLMHQSTGKELFAIIGAIELTACIITGVAITFYAMIKYNKGIF